MSYDPYRDHRLRKAAAVAAASSTSALGLQELHANGSRRYQGPGSGHRSASIASGLESETEYDGSSVFSFASSPSHVGQSFSTLYQPRPIRGASPRLLSPDPDPAPRRRRSSSRTLLASTPEGVEPQQAPLPRRRSSRQSTLRSDAYDSPLRRYVRAVSSPAALSVGLVAVLAIKWAIGLGGYSGQGVGPRYGDFEAQRHWMDLTARLPLSVDWYTYGPDWWQLDYPPATAFHSWLLGKLGHRLLPAAFAGSRGYESLALTTYMRFTVIASELACWIPVVVAYAAYTLSDRSSRTRTIGVLSLLLWPGLVLVDNAHFQYNSVMLGLTLAAILCFHRDNDALGCIAFSLSLCFKQMALYYSPAVFAYLFGKCIQRGLFRGTSQGVELFLKLATSTSLTFVALFAPFLRPFPDAPLYVLHRIFPVARGIFEDKVANFWCASNVVIKWRNYFAPAGMAKLATLATLVALAPSTYLVLTSPRTRLLPLALFASSLSFFLFSFQVHEKSILLPALPLLLLLLPRGEGRNAIAADRAEREWQIAVLVLNTATFSMFPLFKVDGIVLQYAVMQVMWNFAIGYNPLKMASGSLKTLSIVSFAHEPPSLLADRSLPARLHCHDLPARLRGPAVATGSLSRHLSCPQCPPLQRRLFIMLALDARQVVGRMCGHVGWAKGWQKVVANTLEVMMTSA